MKANELRGRDQEDLRRELEALRRQIFDLRFKWQAEESPDTSLRRKARRDIARILTILRQQQRAAGGEEPKG